MGEAEVILIAILSPKAGKIDRVFHVLHLAVKD
jgi:hypothetical protein